MINISFKPSRKAGVQWTIPVFLVRLPESCCGHGRGRGGPDVGSCAVAGDVISAERPVFIKGKKKIKDTFNSRLIRSEFTGFPLASVVLPQAYRCSR